MQKKEELAATSGKVEERGSRTSKEERQQTKREEVMVVEAVACIPFTSCSVLRMCL